MGLAVLSWMRSEIRLERGVIMIEKILERLREIGQLEISLHGGRCNGKTLALGYKKGIENAIEIVQEVAKEYGNGWIPVERELPREHLWAGNMKSYEVFVTYLDSDGKERVSTDNTYNGKWCYFGNRVIAWMPKNAPTPYQKGE